MDMDINDVDILLYINIHKLLKLKTHYRFYIDVSHIDGYYHKLDVEMTSSQVPRLDPYIHIFALHAFSRSSKKRKEE